MEACVYQRVRGKGRPALQEYGASERRFRFSNKYNGLGIEGNEDTGVIGVLQLVIAV